MSTASTFPSSSLPIPNQSNNKSVILQAIEEDESEDDLTAAVGPRGGSSSKPRPPTLTLLPSFTTSFTPSSQKSSSVISALKLSLESLSSSSGGAKKPSFGSKSTCSSPTPTSLPPLKTPQPSEQQDNITADQIALLRIASQNKLKSTWDAIFAKYGRDFDGEADEFNLFTGEVVVDNGWGASQRVVPIASRRTVSSSDGEESDSSTDSDEGQDNEEDDEEDSSSVDSQFPEDDQKLDASETEEYDEDKGDLANHSAGDYAASDESDNKISLNKENGYNNIGVPQPIPALRSLYIPVKKIKIAKYRDWSDEDTVSEADSIQGNVDGYLCTMKAHQPVPDIRTLCVSEEDLDLLTCDPKKVLALWKKKSALIVDSPAALPKKKKSRKPSSFSESCKLPVQKDSSLEPITHADSELLCLISNPARRELTLSADNDSPDKLEASLHRSIACIHALEFNHAYLACHNFPIFDFVFSDTALPDGGVWEDFPQLHRVDDFPSVDPKKMPFPVENEEILPFFNSCRESETTPRWSAGFLSKIALGSSPSAMKESPMKRSQHTYFETSGKRPRLLNSAFEWRHE